MAEETRAYQTPPECSFSMSGIHNGKKWGNMPYRKYKGFPEGLKHKTLKGEKVRSKSEALIANMLFVKNIEYHYEEEIDVGGRTIPPDFRIYVKSQNKFKLLEHLGLLVKEKYRSDALEKMELYFPMAIDFMTTSYSPAMIWMDGSTLSTSESSLTTTASDLYNRVRFFGLLERCSRN